MFIVLMNSNIQFRCRIWCQNNIFHCSLMLFSDTFHVNTILFFQTFFMANIDDISCIRDVGSRNIEFQPYCKI